MSFTPSPALDAVSATFVGAGYVTPPALDAVTAQFSAGVSGVLSATVEDPTALIAGAVGVRGQLLASVSDPVATFVGQTQEPGARGTLSATVDDPTAVITAQHGVAGQLLAAVDDPAATIIASQGVRGTLAATVADPTAQIIGIVHRYEVRTEIRVGGLRVDRRAVCLSIPGLQVVDVEDSIAGFVRLNAGFDATAEVLVTCCDVVPGAAETAPPARRVGVALADDNAWSALVVQ